MEVVEVVTMTPQQSSSSADRLAPAMCPVRPGDPCTLCHPGSRGPETCGLVYLVMTDPELRGKLRSMRRERQLVAC